LRFCSGETEEGRRTVQKQCTAMVAVHCAKITAQVLARKEARNAAQGTVWRSRTEVSA
jgi:hypothetical protein